jgi:glutathione S-transferase
MRKHFYKKMRKEQGFDERETDSALDRMENLELGDIWADCPNVCAWFERIKARPAYAKTYYAKTRLSEIYDGVDLGAAENTAPVVTA